MLLTKKIVFITGGAGLIGRAFVKGLLEQGALVVIGEKDYSGALQFVDSLEEYKDQCIVQEMDIVSPESVQNAVDVVHKKYGKIDALINNAYPRNEAYGAKFFDVKYEDFCENISLNVGGYFLCSQKFAKYFHEQGHGNIVNISSIYGSVAPKFQIYNETSMTMPVEYSSIKSSIIHLTKYMAKYLNGFNIRVNCLSPGGIKDRQPDAFQSAYSEHCINKGMLDAEDLIGGLVFLLSDSSMYFNGQNLIIDDGFTL
ncbi:MAG: oxidoreductase [Colwellia sp.]|jgi:Dehydrogenases with different specificities (related to short-chain alcohol dehydrogenases)